MLLGFFRDPKSSYESYGRAPLFRCPAYVLAISLTRNFQSLRFSIAARALTFTVTLSVSEREILQASVAIITLRLGDQALRAT